MTEENDQLKHQVNRLKNEIELLRKEIFEQTQGNMLTATQQEELQRENSQLREAIDNMNSDIKVM